MLWDRVMVGGCTQRRDISPMASMGNGYQFVVGNKGKEAECGEAYWVMTRGASLSWAPWEGGSSPEDVSVCVGTRVHVWKRDTMVLKTCLI